MDDRQLVSQFLKDRDEKAFRALYRSKTPHLYKMAYRLTQDINHSNDLIQEMWIIAVRKLDDFEWRSELRTWLTGILLNLVRSMRKNHNRELELKPEQFKPETRLERDILNAYDLEVSISKLPPGYRQIVILHDIEGYKHHEIAELLDIHEGTSKSQLYHARKALRKYLTGYQIQKKIKK